MKDLVTAFAAANIPFEKLKKRDDGTSPLLRQFLDKYIRLDGDLPNVPDPDNLRRTHLPKVKEAGGLRNAFISVWFVLQGCKGCRTLFEMVHILWLLNLMRQMIPAQRTITA